MEYIVFDHFYRDYDEWYSSPMGAFVDRVETECAWNLLRPRAGARMLDIGCGTGNFSLKLARLGCSVTGVDLSRRMLDQARAKAAREGLEITFLPGDAARLPFPDGSFDGALSMAAFEFLPDPARVYREVYRVLKPGGCAVIGTIQRGGAWAELYGSPACAGTAYQYATFLDLHSLFALDEAAFTAAEECLFVPPTAEQKEFTLRREAEGRAKGGKGGFVCVKFQKAAP